MKSFKKIFQELTGNPPFPWQQSLYELFIKGEMPGTASIPTGLGKTSVIVIWLLALAQDPSKVPRRLLYVVNRRTVVDQTTEEVEIWRDRLENSAALTDLRKHLQVPTISTLRGQFADNKDWSADPSRPAVICGTVDMIGSRLLFSGYGIGFKSKPLHAGFLGQDTLLIHDEAHLEPAFQSLITSIAKEQRNCNERSPLRIMALTATARNRDQVFTLSDKDLKDDTVSKRINAKKELHLHSIPYDNKDTKKKNQEKKLSDMLSEKALTFQDSNQNILIFVRKIDDLMKIQSALKRGGQDVVCLTGTMRGHEREELTISNPTFLRFLQAQKTTETEATKTAYLLCTSAGEVGVNISANHLICDLSTFDSMAQRFGRVNRFGTHQNTEIHVMYPQKFDDNSISEQRKKTLSLLEQLDGSANSHSLTKLPPKECHEAFSPPPTILPATDILFDTWSMTSIKGPMPGRPPVAVYLHGISDYEVAETRIAWREEVQYIDTNILLEQYTPEILLEDFPLKPHEILKDISKRIFKTLKKMSEKKPETQLWIIDSSGSIEVTALKQIIINEESSIEHKTILLPPSIGGLHEGIFSEKSTHAADVSELWGCAESNSLPLRLRQWNNDSTDVSQYRLIRHINMQQDVGEHTAESGSLSSMKTWRWYELPAQSDGQGSRNAKLPVSYGVHIKDVVDQAKMLVNNLPELNDEEKTAVVLSARWHDLGKQRTLWQKSIGNLGSAVLAKSGGSMRSIINTRYRHEFGSLIDASKENEFQKLSAHGQDIVLHLIASHHGRARPHFPEVEIFDPETSDNESQSIALASTLRFDRLQRHYGRWGLAWIESLLRAADYAASAKPSAFMESES